MNFLARLEMRAEYHNPSTAPVIKDEILELFQGLPEKLRPWGKKIYSLFDKEGNSGKLRSFAGGMLVAIVVLLGGAAVVLAFLLILAVCFMVTSIYGFFWPSLVAILVGMAGIIVLRYGVPTFDMPLNAGSGVVDFLNPADGTGMIGGTIKGFFDQFKSNPKPAPEDREPISYFTDRSISVAIAWAMLSALGCMFAMVLDPVAAPPAYAFMLAGVLWLYAMLETLRKGWRPIAKNDERRYVPASWRQRLYRTSVGAMTVLGAGSFVFGLLLAVFMGGQGSSRLLVTSQTVGEDEVTLLAANNGVAMAPTNNQCKKAIAQARADEKEFGISPEKVCAKPKNAGSIMCVCLSE
jgi:hypothetical protein